MHAPPIASKHPMLRRIEELSRDRETRQAIIDGIRRGGAPEQRMGRIEAQGLLDPYGEADEAESARKALLGGAWGDANGVLQISDALADALDRVTDEKPLVCWVLSGATESESTATVHETDEAVYLMLLTRPIDAEVVTHKLRYDLAWLAEIRQQSEELARFLDDSDV